VNDRNNLREEQMYRSLMRYMADQYGLSLDTVRPERPGVSVLYDVSDGRWHACGRRISGSRTGRQEDAGYYAIEIPFDPEMIPLLEKMEYCARAQFMDSSQWLMLVINSRIDISSYMSLISLSDAWMKHQPQTINRPEPVYQDVRIPQRQQRSSAENDVPEKIREMIRMDHNGFTPEQKAKNFYNQAMFMKDYTDDYVFRGTFSSASPVYHQMTAAQLRGYFAWRTWVKENGEIPVQTQSSFLLLYIFELLNLVHGDPDRTFQKLMDIREQNARISVISDLYLLRWISDFAVYYGLGEEYLSECFVIEDLKHYRILSETDRNPDTDEYTDDEIGEALMTLSRADVAGSTFMKDHQEEMKRYLTIAYRLLCREFRKDNLSFCSNHICSSRSASYPMFPQAVFHEEKPHEDTVIYISKSNIFQCTRGYWTRLTLVPRMTWHSVVREADRIARRELNGKRQLKQQMESGRIISVLEEAMKIYLKERQEALRPKIHINMDMLSSIRRDAAKTRDSLLVSDEEEGTETEVSAAEEAVSTEIPQEKKTDAEPQREQTFFTAEESDFLNALLAGRKPSVSGSMQVLCDGINEKMLDEIGDTVIEYDGDQPELIEDYAEDLRNLLQGGR